MPALPDYFALYNISPTLSPDPAVLRKRYYELSRQYHPDRIPSGDSAAQIEALTMSAQVNEGFRILGDEDARLGYVLVREGVLETEEHYKLPAEFLMEMMELNEAVGNVAMAPDMQPEAARELQRAIEAWESGIAPLRQRFNEGERNSELLAGLKEYYF
jgi:molecular chaperone HscB